MFRTLITRIQQGFRTVKFPSEKIVSTLPDTYRGIPKINRNLCQNGCKECIEICPTAALNMKKESRNLSIDLGKCLFCNDCQQSCAAKAISFSKEYRMSSVSRNDLILENDCIELSQKLDEKMKKIFKRSLRLRQVSAGGCNGCELDTNVLNTPVFDLARFGIQFVASPRHADGILVTGPVTKNMQEALLKTYDAIPSPKIVIAVGACAISGGPFIGHPEVCNGVDSLLKVDLYVPGCPPHPFTILDGLVNLF